MIVPSGIYTGLKEMLLEVCSGKLRPFTGLGYLKNLPHLKISGKYPIVYLVRVKVLKLVAYKTVITLLLQMISRKQIYPMAFLQTDNEDLGGAIKRRIASSH